jgi:hypothetical protein
MREQAAVTGDIVQELEIPAREHWSGLVKDGQMMRIVDLEGEQGVDFLVYAADDHRDRYAAADTMKINGTIFIDKGTVLYSINCNPLMTVTEDTCGSHDTIGGCCSDAINRTRYHAPGQRNCRENFLAELDKWGMDERDIVPPVNFFAYVPIGPNGEMDFRPPISKPGDSVDLRAERDVLVLISNCPQINNPAAGFNPTPIRITIWRPA